MREFSLRPHIPFVFFLCMFVVLAVGTARAGAKMPHFNLTDAATNKKIDSATYAGKAKLVVFFATWCMPCMQEVPALINLQNEYGNDDFIVVAISVDNNQENVESFIKKSDVNYPVLMFDQQVVADFGGIPGLPTTFMVDKNDNVLKKYPGLVPHALLEREVKSMLESVVQDSALAQVQQEGEIPPPSSSPLSQVVEQESSSHSEEMITHIVAQKETLWGIAEKYLGNPFKYVELARLNKIKDPFRIYPGDTIFIKKKMNDEE